MVVRQFKPIETSCPCGVKRLLWHAKHRSEVWKCSAGLSLTPEQTASYCEHACENNERSQYSSH